MAASAEMLMPEVDFAYDALPDLHRRLDVLRQTGPVVRVKYLGQPVWLILGYNELASAFDDVAHFDAADGYKLIAGPSMGRTLQTMSGAEHRANKALVTSPFLPGKARAYIEGIIEPIANELLDRIEGQDEVEFIEAFTRPYPFKIITHLLGIPVADEPLFLHWAVKLIDFPWDPEGALAAKQGFTDYMTPLIDQRRTAPGGDFISMLVSAEHDGERLDNEAILSFLRLLFPAGSDTTYKLGGSMFANVLADPALRAMALAGEKQRDAIVSEALRWQAPTALLPRMASADVELGGALICKGDWTLFGITGANNDPALFPDPRRFDPTRANANVLSFGRGVHFCVGSHLARRELEVALRLVLERFPDMTTKPGADVEYAGGVIRGPKELWVRPRG